MSGFIKPFSSLFPTVEVGQQVLALHLLAFQLDLAVGAVVALEVGQVQLKDAAAQAVSRQLDALRAVHQRLAGLALWEGRVGRGCEVDAKKSQPRLRTLVK